MPITLKEGDPAPVFSLKDADGRIVSLASLAGSRVILHFHENGMDDCGFAAVLEDCKKRDIKVVGIAREAVPAQGVLSLADPSADVAKSYGVYGKRVIEGRTVIGLTRATFLLDEDGKVVQIQAAVVPAGHAAEALAGFGDR